MPKTQRKRHSPNAKAVALDVIANLGKSRKITMGKILKKNGYSDSMSKNPKMVTDTQSFKETMDPVVQSMMDERVKVIERLKKTRSKAKYRDLIDGLDKLTKNIQLISGGDTERNSGMAEIAKQWNDVVKMLNEKRALK